MLLPQNGIYALNLSLTEGLEVMGGSLSQSKLCFYPVVSLNGLHVRYALHRQSGPRVID